MVKYLKNRSNEELIVLTHNVKLYSAIMNKSDNEYSIIRQLNAKIRKESYFIERTNSSAFIDITMKNINNLMYFHPKYNENIGYSVNEIQLVQGKD